MSDAASGIDQLLDEPRLAETPRIPEATWINRPEEAPLTAQAV